MICAQETKEKVDEFSESNPGRREVKKKPLIPGNSSPADLHIGCKACFLLVVTGFSFFFFF